MARIITSGGEIRDHPTATIGGPDGYSGGAAATTTDLTTFRSGKASIKCPGTSANSSYRIFPFSAPSAGTSLFARIYIRLSALPDATKVIARFSAGATNIASVRLTSGGKLQLWRDVATAVQYGSDSADTLAVDRWYRIEFKQKIGTGATDEFELLVATDETPPPDYPGVQVASVTAQTVTDTQPTELRVGWVEAPGVTSNMFLDDVAVNDSTGTKETGHAGEGKVAYLIPAAELASSGWTCTTGIDNILAAVSNLPPAGHDDVTDVGHSPHHHRSASSTVGVSVLEAISLSYAGAGVSGPVILPKTGGASGGGRIGAATNDTINVNGQKVAQSLKVSGTIEQAEVYLDKLGSPTDNVIFELQTDSAGTPSGTVLATQTIAASDVPSSLTWHSLDFAGQILAPETPYWIVARRSGSLSDTDVVRWQDSSLTYTDGTPYIHNGTSWQQGQGADRALRIFVSDTSTIRLVQVVACHAEGISTGTKTGNLTSEANPVIAATAVTFGDNVGAATAYPGTWRWSKTAVSYDPSLASHAVAPQPKLTKTDGTTRAALLCALGALVEFIPPASPGWQQYTKTSDSSLWWAKYVSSTTGVQWGTDGVNKTEVLGGDYALHADPLPAEEADMGEITSVDRATLDSSYTKV